jgi:hypothetical protein
MKLPELSFTWLDMLDRNTSNCFKTDSNRGHLAMCFPFGSCLQVEDMISEKKKKKKCQINMSKANLKIRL